MGEVSTIGLDIAKLVFQVHGVDGTGAVVMRKRIGRAKVLEFFGGLSPCLVGLEACPSAHYWSRELQALGHMVKLMPPSYVKAYLKRSKNDANDAAAICEAVTRPSMRFVPIKSQQQQSDHARRADGSKRSQALVRSWPLRWLPRSATGERSALGAV
jgi:transposase